MNKPDQADVVELNTQGLPPMKGRPSKDDEMGGNRMPFTEGRVAAMKCQAGKSQTIFRDPVTPGLGVRVTSTGAKSYIFEAKFHGQVTRQTIGSPKAWPLAKAREEARSRKVALDQEIDPREQKKRLAAEVAQKRLAVRREQATLAALWEDYLAAPHPGWGDRTRLDHQKISQPGGEPYKRGSGVTKAGELFPLMSVKLNELNQDRIQAWIASSPNKTRVALAFRLLRAALRWGRHKEEYAGLIQESAWEGSDVKQAVPAVVAKRSDVLDRNQLEGWFREVRKLRNPVISAYLQGLLLTGARRQELAELRWVDVDYRRSCIHVKDKVDESRVRDVPLTPYLASLLSELPRVNEWVFSSPGATKSNGHIAEPTKAHNRVLESAGIEHVTIHGLRRTFRNMGEWLRLPVGVTAQIMGHKPSALAERHYTQRPLDLLAVWHNTMELWILKQAGIEFQLPDSTKFISLERVAIHSEGEEVL